MFDVVFFLFKVLLALGAGFNGQTDRVQSWQAEHHEPAALCALSRSAEQLQAYFATELTDNEETEDEKHRASADQQPSFEAFDRAAHLVASAPGRVQHPHAALHRAQPCVHVSTGLACGPPVNS